MRVKNLSNRLQLFPVLCLLLFYSCSRQRSTIRDEEQIETITVSVNEMNNSIPWYSILDSISFIKLETDKDCAISNIRRIIVHDDHFYIHDFMNHRILVFNSKGKFISKIEKRGAGPGEYLDLRDFAIDDEFIYILTYNRILKYAFNGNYIEDIRIPELPEFFSPLQFMKYDNTFYFWRGAFGAQKINRKKFSLIKTDLKMNVLETKFPIIGEFANSKKFTRHDENYYLTYNWGNDTIYELSKFIRAKYYIDFGEDKLDEKDIPEGFGTVRRNFFTDLINTNKCGNISDVFEDKNIVYFTFHKNNHLFHSIFIKENQTLYTGKLGLSQPISPLIIQGKVQDKYYSILESFIVKGFLGKYYDSNSSYKFLKELLDVDYDDNPVIMLFKFNNV